MLSVALRKWLCRKDRNAVTYSHGVLRNAGGPSTSVPTVQASSPVIPAAVVGQHSRARSGLPMACRLGRPPAAAGAGRGGDRLLWRMGGFSQPSPGLPTASSGSTGAVSTVGG